MGEPRLHPLRRATARLLFKTEINSRIAVGGVAPGDANLFAQQEAPVGAI